MAHLEKTVQELRHELATSQRTANQKQDSLNEIIKSLSAKDKISSVSIADLTRISLKFTANRWQNSASRKNRPGALSGKG